MKYLCLDLATVTGFTFGDEAGVQAHGSFRLPSTGVDIGGFLFAYQEWLHAGLARWQPDQIVFESPILPATTSIVTLRKLYSLCGITELIASNRHIPVREANLTHIRLHFIKVARAPKTVLVKDRRAWIKARTVAECRSRGFRPADDNDADALALFSYTLAQARAPFRMLGDEIPVAA